MNLGTSKNLPKHYNFHSHVVFGVENEPLAGCVAGNKLLLSTLGHSIEVRNLDDYGSLSHTFSTVDLVKQMLYSSVGKYIATLEVKTTRLNLTTHVRLYFNWQIEASGVAMRARIAGRVTPSSQSGVGQLEMVELPLKQQACHVNCCVSTANLVVGCARCVSVYRFCVKVHPISKIQFQDVEHMLDVYVTFPLKEVALCEEFVACMSSCEIQVVKLIHSDVKAVKLNYNPPMRSPQVNVSPLRAIDDSNLIVLSSPIDQQSSKLEYSSLPTTVTLPSLVDPSRYEMDRCNGPRVVMGPLDYFAGLPAKVENVDLNFGGFRTVSLLYQRFPSILPTNSAPYFCLHSLQFLPFYIPNAEMPQTSNVELSHSSSDPFRSPRRSQLRRLEVFFSGQNEGYLYNVSDKVHLISTYNYEDRVYHVSVENTVLHAVCSGGVYTYSLSHWNRIIEHILPDKPDRQPCFHSFNIKNILLAFHPFVGVQLATFGDDFLVLLTNNCESELENGGNNWTVYAIQCPLAEAVYRNLLEDEGNESCDEEQRWYLLHDAHCALATEVLLYNPPTTSRLSRLFQQASFQLGDIYLRTDPWSAVAFYGMGGGSLDELIEHILQGPEMLTNKGNICSALSLIFVKDYFECTKELSQELADAVLRLISDAEPILLSSLILKKILRGYDNSLAAELLLSRFRKQKCGTLEDTLATCVCCVAAGQMECLPTLMMTVSDESLLSIVVKYPHVWMNGEHASKMQFTPLMQVLQQLKPDLFVKIVLRLFSSGIANSVIVARHLCQTDSWEEYGLAPKSDSLLVHFLEEFIRNKYECDEATICLAGLYLKELEEEEELRLPPQMKPWRLFAPRQHWLNRLPPFAGRSMSSENCLLKSSVEDGTIKGDCDLGCPCSDCNNCLLRLQSLLCGEAANGKVKQSLSMTIETSMMEVRGVEALLVLCCPSPLEGVQRLADSFPSALVEYCVDNVGPNEIKLWREIVEILTSKLNADEAWILEGVVAQLAETLDPIDFVQLIPNGAFPAQLVRSINKYQSKQLHELIVSEGKAMANRI